MRTTRNFSTNIIAGALALFGLAVSVSAQDYQYTPQQPYTPQYPPYQQYPTNAPPVTPAVPQPVVTLSPQQIDQLVGPVALYPDPLLAQIFPAATYPQDVASAEQWLQTYPNVTEDDIQAQNWDPSIKALIHYPTVLQQMSQNLDWTQALGAAFLNQQQDVLDSVQRLRAAAQANGTLQSNAQQQVINDDGAIRIEPVDPNTVYVPQYDPNAVYAQQTAITYGVGIPIGIWLDCDFDWHNRWINVGGGWYQGWHHPAEWDRHPPAWRTNPPAWYKKNPNWDHYQTHGVAISRWSRINTKPAPRLTVDVVNRLALDRNHEIIHGVAPAVRINHLPPPLPVGPRPPVPVVEPSRNAFETHQTRAQVDEAEQRARANREPAHVAPPKEVPHEAPRVVEPPRTPDVHQAPHVNAPPPRVEEPQHSFPAPSGNANDAHAESDRGHESNHH